MYTNFKKRFLIPLVILLLLCFAGCKQSKKQEHPPVSTQPTTPVYTPTVSEETYKEDPAAYIVFTRSAAPTKCYVSVSEIMEYTTQYPDCNGTWFRDQFQGEDLCIYNGYLYAMENHYTSFELYVEDNDKDFSYIRNALSLDSPFVAQNYDHSEKFWSQPTNYIGERLLVHSDQFTASRWEKNMEALEKCREIVSTIPDTASTQEAKMEYLYRYVCENVAYEDYDLVGRDDYLYDAVIEGVTFCDGYSNMLNLLFRLAGIESYEAMGSNVEDLYNATEEELENYGGHTWVVAQLDGQFYNFDPTFDSTTDWNDGVLHYFAYSDDLVSTKYIDLEQYRPKCTDTSRDFPYAHMIVANITDENIAKSIVDLTEQRASNGEYSTIIAVQAPVSSGDFDNFLVYYEQYNQKIRHVDFYFEDMRNSTVLELVAKT